MLRSQECEYVNYVVSQSIGYRGKNISNSSHFCNIKDISPLR